MSSDKTGAVLVVGAGIAGIQASLDLAESGYYVYLVEKSPAIGGTMPMLDKTFPTNDCSMCIVSPKLVECGRHLNIKTLTCSEVIDLKGEPGKYKATIRKQARYIDLDKCTGCGECAQVCPVECSNSFDEGLSKRKAIYKLYPQAMPSGFAIEKTAAPPCRAACPAGVNAQGYVQLLKKGKLTEGWQLIYRDNPLPAICGRVCTHPCESKCHRGSFDEPVAIRQLKRLVTDVVYKDVASLPLPVPAQRKEERVAVIGSGPAGLSAAYQLAKRGYPVTVFEARDKLGGMLRYGIPSYRLPREWLDLEIGLLEKLGVEFKTNTPLGPEFTLADIQAQGYRAVFVGVGAWKGTSLNLPGEDMEDVIVGVNFLIRVNSGENVKVGAKVAVVGGGNTAMDAARVALRQGAKEVTIVYRRTEAEITAAPEEIEEAKEEGINFLMLTSPKAFHSEGGKLKALECLRNELGEPDESGRRRPVSIPGSEFLLEVDTCIVAVGQAPDTSFSAVTGLATGRGGKIAADKDTLATSLPGVFAGGDAVTGPATVIDAIAAGKKTAESIDRYLQGLDLKEGRLEDQEDVAQQPEPPANAGQCRVDLTYAEPAARKVSYEEVANGYSLEEGQLEAERCLNCGVCSECLECVKVCQAGAILHDMKEEIVEIDVGAVILSPGFDKYDASDLDYYGYGRLPNVMTSLEFERVLSASGPFGGHLVRSSDGKEPKKIAWIQCVGSRNLREENGYCSGVCCMYAIKEAVVAKEHSPQGLDTAIFFMDMRTHGKGFEKYYDRAKEQGVRFIRSRIFEVVEKEGGSGDLLIRYAGEDGTIFNESFDMVVLSVGLKPKAEAVELAGRLNLELNRYNFCETSKLSGVGTSREGIFVAGAFSAPRDIPETVMQASAASGESAALLADACNTLVKSKEFPPERNVYNEIPRVGVFICHCGINIGSVVNVPEVVEYARTLPGVAYAVDNMYTCSQDTQNKMKELIKEYNLNRIVVASCSPRTHEPLFQETLRDAGLNQHLFEMANIRDQCSWVHKSEPAKATEKAKDLVRMSVAKALLLEPVKQISMPMNHGALVIGGGVAGMTNALNLADRGYHVHLVEKSARLGGMANQIKNGLNGEDINEFLTGIITKVKNHANITVHTECNIADVRGYVGNFETTLSNNEEIKHGVAIIAIGGQAYKPTEYLYGQHPNVYTQLEIEEAIASGKLEKARNIVLINCVGSREPERPYCSRVCCTKNIKLALKIKEKNPSANIFVLYRDIRTYAFYEDYYREARSKGIIFVRYSIGNKPVVVSSDEGLKVTVTDHVLGVPIEINADAIGLAAAIATPEDNAVLSQLFKVPLDQEGFFLEAHLKLRPVDFSTDGVFMCGLAQGPKSIEESITQAKAAAGRAGTLLSKEFVEAQGKTAYVNKKKCAMCGACESLCPSKAIAVDLTEKAAVVNEALCKGCGVCASSCRCGALEVKGVTNQQITDMLCALS
ncbi:NAD(P)-binding protein [Pelotomaculum propionicicum]|uniref:NADPH-Fe(3+) oxidoreductase subunit beta n=1 Tax=Pelotomaculum propionicicum TaxID=258475 RepID=A0A4Y7RII2_9FIRM|nr:NAD(P)-binding protein [Pelotomaculum propionicicum]TEB08795.1 NADPH-Fe(3+) oxidoreductase subunit beta [Pelotomaculum propionicicum]